jgi:hypothetical protein
MMNCTGSCPPVATTSKLLCPADIATDFSPAVVDIKIVPRFRAFWDNYSRWIEEVQGATHYNAGILPLSSTGFYTPKGYIVSTSSFTSILWIASWIMTFSTPFCWQPGTNEETKDFPAFQHSRSVPDPATLYVNRYHDLPGFMDVLNEMCNGGCFADWFDFMVDITRTNNSGRCAATYRAYLAGIDFESGMAWFKIKNSNAWNRCLDPIVRQHVLKFGNSKQAQVGSTVHTIYGSRVTGHGAMATGVVSDNSGMLRDGSVPFEVLFTDMIVEEGAEGAPILNQCGQVIGMIVGATHHGKAVGITSAFVERIHNAIVDSNCTPNCSPHAVFIASFGCYVYRHGTLDITYHLKTALDLNQALLRTAVGNGNCRGCNGSGDCKSCGSYSDEYWRNEFYNYENCRINRELIGVVMDTNPCGVLAAAVEECSIRDPNFGQVQRRFFQIEKGDIITHINGLPIGSRTGQQSPENIFYSLEPCVCVDIEFLKEAERYTQVHHINVKLEDSLNWIPDFMPCCTPCLSFLPSPVMETFSNFLSQVSVGGVAANIGSVLPGSSNIKVGKIVENIAELVVALQCWFRLIRWFTHALPAIYRSAFLSNLTVLMTRLNEWVSFLTSPQPTGAPSLFGGPAYSPISVGVTLTQLNRIIVTSLAVPSIEAAVRPIPFFDYISSIPHPNTTCAFEQTIPNYLALIGSKVTQCYRAYGSEKKAEEEAAETVFCAPFSFPVDSEDVQREIKKVRID